MIRNRDAKSGRRDEQSAELALRMERIVAYGNRYLDRVQPHWPGKVSVRRPRPTTIVYASYPYYFVDAFPTTHERDVRRLAVAMRLIADSVCVTDVLCDYAAGPRITYDIMTVQALQFEAYRILFAMFCPKAVFWSRFRCHMSEWMAACVQEVDLIRSDRHWSDASDEILVGVARGKAALAKAVVDALGELSGYAGPVEALTSSVERCHLGVQLIDDLQDWKDDLARGVPTHVGLSLAKARPDLSGCEFSDAVWAAYARHLYYGGGAARAIGDALLAFDEAVRLIDDVPVPAWQERIARCRKRAEALAQDLEAIARVNRGRTTAPARGGFAVLPTPNLADHDVRAAVYFLLREQHTGFGEARHVLPYPWEFDPYGEQPAQSCDVHQRALVMDALAELRIGAPAVLESAISRELEYLVGARSEAECWTYFPGVAELPGSADVTAQVVIALHRSGGVTEEWHGNAANALRAIFARSGRPNGSYSNWIVSEKESCARDAAGVLGLTQDWIRTPDVGVTANVGYALTLHDSLRYADRIANTVRFVLRWQQRAGDWPAFGLYARSSYSTYLCARLISRSPTGGGALLRALAHVRATQRPDGGWGRTTAPGEASLDTAASVLTLALAADLELLTDADRARIHRGVEFLRTLRNPNGSWPKVTFMRIGREEYGSRTVTTALVLRALLCAED